MPIDEIDEEMIKTKDLEIETKHEHEHEHEDGTKHSHEHTHSDDIEDHSHKHDSKPKTKPKNEPKKKEVVRPSSKTGIEIPKTAKIGKDFTIKFSKKWDQCQIDVMNGLHKAEPTTEDPFRKPDLTGDTFLTVHGNDVDGVTFKMANWMPVKGKEINVLEKGDVLVKVYVVNQASDKTEFQVVSVS
jgi:hypothetical protein